MEAKLQEAINKLPVIQKAHIYEPKLEDVAEISFKAGYEQGLKEQGSPRADAEIRLADKEFAKRFRKEWLKDEKTFRPFKAGRQAGIREVVELLIKNSNQTLTQAGLFQVVITTEEWQAFLKEKGIEKCTGH